jgi:transposase
MVKRQERGAEGEERVVDVGAPLVADREAAHLVQVGDRALHDGSVATEPRARVGAAPRDARLDAAGTELTCGVRAIETFARGLAQDGAAVRAAFTSPWSNGQTEGQITKLKLLKRQMYGRANLDLLRRRLLLAA